MSAENQGGTFWVKTLAKGASTVGAATAAICGLAAAISFSGKCIAMGVYLVFFGVIILMFEATFCFMFLDIGKWIEEKSKIIRNWQKMIVYFGLSIPPFIFCGGISSIIGSLGLLVCGMSYMVLTIGPKGSGSTNDSSVPYERQLDNLTPA